MDFEYPDDRGAPPPRAPDSQEETLRAFFTITQQGAKNCRTIGQRNLALSWLAGMRPDIRDQRDLARRMGCGPARVSKVLAEIRILQRRNAERLESKGNLAA